MSESPLFKRAFVRGLNAELIRQGTVVYPSKEAADFSADYVAENSGMPDPYLEAGKVNVKVAAAVCENLVSAAGFMCKEAGDKYSPQVTKTAQAESPVTLATATAWEIMQKCAAETGSLMEGGEVPNDMPAAASENAEAAQEANRRGENYANMGEEGVGNYERKGEGNVGTEEAHPEKPAATEEGTNSLIENTNKHGSLANIVARVGKQAADTGSLIDPGSEQNDMPAAAANNAEAAQEQNRRPENYANKGEKGVGNSDMVPGSAAYVGHEKDHPLKPKATDSGSNVVTEHTTKKSAFNQLFENTAQDIVPFLPEKMGDDVKVAHVRRLMGCQADERSAYLSQLYTSLGVEKTAADNLAAAYLKKAMPEGFMPFKKKKDSDKEEEKKAPPAAKKDEECPSDGEKEASVSSLADLQAALAKLNA